MKRYWLFAGDQFYASGGMQDYQGSFDNIENALEASKGYFYFSDLLQEHAFLKNEWFHILDSELGEIVKASSYQAYGANDKWSEEEVNFNEE